METLMDLYGRDILSKRGSGPQGEAVIRNGSMFCHPYGTGYVFQKLYRVCFKECS